VRYRKKNPAAKITPTRTWGFAGGGVQPVAGRRPPVERSEHAEEGPLREPAVARIAPGDPDPPDPAAGGLAADDREEERMDVHVVVSVHVREGDAGALGAIELGGDLDARGPGAPPRRTPRRRPSGWRS
jgi:hypothetical protein